MVIPTPKFDLLRILTSSIINVFSAGADTCAAPRPTHEYHMHRVGKKAEAVTDGPGRMDALSFAHGRIVVLVAHAHVRGTDYLVDVQQFFDAVSAPARDPRNGEDGCVQLGRQAEHIVYEA